MDKKKMLNVAGAILAYNPPKPEAIEFKMPEIIEPIVIAPSGQERRRERRKRERQK